MINNIYIYIYIYKWNNITCKTWLDTTFNKLPFGKQDFKHFIGYKDTKKLNLCAYSAQK